MTVSLSAPVSSSAASHPTRHVGVEVNKLEWWRGPGNRQVQEVSQVVGCELVER